MSISTIKEYANQYGEQAKQVAMNSVAAGVAIIPAGKKLVEKTYQQWEKVPSVSYRDGIRAGINAAPFVMAIIPVQNGIQKWAEKQIAQKIANDPEATNLLTKVTSSAFSGLATAVPIIWYNKRSGGASLVESVMGKIRPKEFGLVAMQEGCFVLGLVAALPLAAKMQKVFGENKAVDCAAGAIAIGGGAAASHIFNTAITRAGNDMSTSLKQMPLGIKQRTIAMMIFGGVYTYLKQTMNPKKE